MLLKMTRVQIIATHPHLDATIASLHRLGLLHIEEVTKSSALNHLDLDQASLRLRQKYEFLITRLDALIQALPQPRGGATSSQAKLPDRPVELAEFVSSELDQIAPKIREHTEKRDELQAEAITLPRYEATLKKLAPLAVELPELNAHETVAMLIEKRYREVVDLIRVEMERITRGQYEVIAREVGEGTIAAILVYPRSLASEVQAILGQENITQVRLPKVLAKSSFKDSLLALDQRQITIREEIERIDDHLQKIAEEWLTSLIQWRRDIRNRLQELTVREHLGATRYTFVIEGWMPKGELNRLRETLSREVGQQVMVTELETEKADRQHTPVVFANPTPLKPFESLVRLMTIPRYGAFDPTPLLAVFLPLFFGMILGDIGHGVLLLLLTIYLKRRYAAKEMIRDLAQILLYCSIWSIVFGFLYGEFFGSLARSIGLRPLWMPREGHYIVALFIFSLALGVVHVVLGLLLAVWDAWREKQRSELAAKIGMLIVLSAIFAMVSMTADYLPRQMFTPVVIGLLIGLALLIIPAGPLGILLGPLEVIETVGNILSYLRLAAIGLASVYLALVANKMAGMIGNLIVGTIVALLLHALNFALGMVSPTVQSVRLHYVEFFRQFYRGGGQPYRPFRLE
jgi:V/A-type H+-transporting ATPase subunit I